MKEIDDPSYSVTGLVDQLTRTGLLTAYGWRSRHIDPEKATVYLELDRASRLYEIMKDLGMVVFINWEI